ncbi:hypothetical protein M407DRAFT_216184 [Tulasnella calospora MUT 4182]|uniref:DH domain-containing protein n=1 Tax=Tulasnella calospora MUT 4182 TaxID=1051891 RepID=A0A0C3Q2F7_9AGAM|nr:hypothetical protein M407DRAFT_216184 [Tulasnella calospora MUT 4182]
MGSRTQPHPTMSTLLKDRHTLRYGVPNEDGATPTAHGERQDLPVIIPSSSNSSSSSSLALPSSSSTIPSLSHRNSAKWRFAMPPAPELDLLSLLPTPQSSPLSVAPPLPSISAPTLLPDRQQAPPPPPTPPPLPPVPKSSRPPSPLPFPTVRGTGGHRRKTSTVSQISQAQSQAQYSRDFYASTTSNFSSSSAGGSSMPPSVPARSPLRRPTAKSTASFSGILKEFDLAPNSPLPLSPTSPYSTTTHGGPNPNYASFEAGGGTAVRPSPKRRALSRRTSDASESGSSLSSETMMNPNPSFTSFAPTLTPDHASILTATIPSEEKRNNKRNNALLELLSSERAYAADLALVRDIHIPLSKGLPTPFDPTSHSGSLTTLASSARSPEVVNATDIPMPPKTSKIVFGNIDEIAVFADRFSEELEDALGDIILGGVGEDRVGKLFLEMIPVMGPLYKAYITNHPAANTEFQSLPPSPALTRYNAQCRKFVSIHSKAWDVPSFLIKPVQRLLNYPFLLGAIYNETPDSHPDKQNLADAKVKIAEVARIVNESQRRWEVVKAVLDSRSSKSNGTGTMASRAGSPKINPIVRFGSRIKPNSEAANVERDRIELEQWDKRIKECEAVVKDVAKQTLEWNQALDTAMERLRNWNAAFGRVTGLELTGIEAVGAFAKVVQGLQVLSYEFNKTVQTVYLPQLSLLLHTISSPRILLAHTHTLHQSHVALLNIPYKALQPSSLVEASNDYRVLRGTLQEQLPTFVRLFEKGLAALVLEFAEWQMRLWREVKELWTSFWIILATGGEGDLDVAETLHDKAGIVKFWKERYSKVEAILVGFRTVTPTEEAITWEMVERELAYRSMSSTPSMRSYHRRGNSAQPESQLVHVMTGPMIPAPAFIPSPKDKEKHWELREAPLSSNTEDANDTSGSTEDPVPKPVEPHAQNRGPGMAFGDSASIPGDTGSLHAMSLRPFRRKLTDTVFGTPRSSTYSQTTFRQSNALSDLYPDLTASHRFSGTSSLGPPTDPSRDSISLLQPSRLSGSSFVPEVTVQFQLDEEPRVTREASRSSNNENAHDTVGGTEASVPRLLEPYAQDRGVGMALARATSLKPNNLPVSPRDKKKAKEKEKQEKEKHQFRELDDSASIRGDAGSIRATNPRPFRQKLTDTLFGPPRFPSHSRTRSQQSNTLSEPDPDWKGSRRSSDTSSLEPPAPSAHSRNAFSSLPPLRVGGTSFASEAPVPFQLDPPPSPLYTCVTVCPFKYDRSATYMNLPVLDLDIGDTIHVLYEAGHPKEHALPGYVDEGDDCLLAAREDLTGRIGWTLASYVIPIQ